MKCDLLIKDGEVILPDVGRVKKNIAVSNGKIQGILEPNSPVKADKIISVPGKIIMPGIIDAHTHLTMGDSDNPYFTETRTAAVGGVTTVLTYLFQSEPYKDLFERDLEQVQNNAVVDVGFHFGIATDKQRKELDVYNQEFGVTSYKFFMNFRGDEGKYLDLEPIDDGLMYDLFSDLSKFKGNVVATHPENIEVIWRLRSRVQEEGKKGLSAWDLSRPAFVEAENILRALYFAKQTNACLYIPHLTCKLGLEEIRRFKEVYNNFYVETCPHYLTHNIESSVGDLGKVNPPLRTRDDQEALWEALIDGTIDVVASDHVPRTKKFKNGGIWKATAGFPGIATLLPVLLSEGYHKRGVTLERIVQVLSENPAKIFGLYPQKGVIKENSDADFTIVDLELEKEVHCDDLQSYCDYTIYENWKLKGWPVMAILRGEVIMENGDIKKKPGYGNYLNRTKINMEG